MKINKWKNKKFIGLLLITVEEMFMNMKMMDLKKNNVWKQKKGTNAFIWLKKCKGFQICVDLPYHGGINRCVFNKSKITLW